MMDLQEKTSLLSRTGLFASCKAQMLEQIAEFCSIYAIPKGGAVFLPGDSGNSLYIVKSGEISVLQYSAQSHRQHHEIARYSAGDFFGEVDMLMNTKRNAEARAAEDSELLRFPSQGKGLQDLLLAYPPTGAELLHLFMQTTAARIRKSNALLKENSPWVQEMRTQVYGDKLTGLYNKTFLEERLPSYLTDAARPVSLLMVKPDNFKFINDNFGHEAGDQALVAIGTALVRHVPENAVTVRFMGNELACVFPDTDRQKALLMAEDIRSLLNKLDVSSMTGGKPFELSVSIGAAVFPDHAREAAGLIAAAHELPLIGRERGGNKILFPEDKQE
ncbi:MAG: GGDEF domain-containing protein [Spirochaetales bacterium]|jgi:diguanylate cyclase (GGDEF)-like protein|nr:GGDEF domain-containing protein [Spirochaetales bacterium]